MSNSKKADNRPVHTIRLGAIRAAVWENPSRSRKGAVTHAVTIAGRYLDEDSGEWKTTHSFRLEELVLVAKVADMAHTWIYERRQKAEEERSEAA